MNNNLFGEECDKSSGTVLNELKKEDEEEEDQMLSSNKKKFLREEIKNKPSPDKGMISELDERISDNQMCEEFVSNRNCKRELIIQPIEVQIL